MKKDTSTHSLSPKIQEAFSKTQSTFDQVTNRFDSASQDIKLTEKLLGEKNVPDPTFVINFGRIEDMYNGDGSEDFPGWDPEEFGQETLDWRKDPESDRHRLMVSTYSISIDRYQDPDSPNGFKEVVDEIFLESTKPLIECPIEVRLYYHPRLAQFITTFADAIQEHLINKGLLKLNAWYSIERDVGRTTIQKFGHYLSENQLNIRNKADS